MGLGAESNLDCAWCRCLGNLTGRTFTRACLSLLVVPAQVEVSDLADVLTGVVLFAALWLTIGVSLWFILDRALCAHAKRREDSKAGIVARAFRWPLFVAIVFSSLYWLVRGIEFLGPDMNRFALGAILVIVGGALAHGVSSVAVRLYEHRGKRRPSFRGMLGLLSFLTRLGVYSIALLLVLQHMGIALTPIIGALGIGALAVALALQDTLANFFAGLYLSLDRPLRPGDYVEIDGGTFGTVKAYVLEVGWRSVRMRELPDNVFVVPNTRIASGIIKNYDLPQTPMSVVLQCSVAYDSDLAEVERVVVDEARTAQRTIEGAVPDHDPFIRYHTFGDNGIGFSIILRVKTFVDQYLLTHEFFKMLHARFKEEGIVIPFPQRTLHMPQRVQVETHGDGDGVAREELPRSMRGGGRGSR